MQSSDEDQDDVQVIRLTSMGKTTYITTHQDPSSGKTIVLWNDILKVFPDALYLQRGKRVVSFLKGADFEDLQPPRIAAIPGAILDIIVKDELKEDVGGSQQEGTTVTPLATPPQPKPVTTVPTTFRRNPTFGDELAALENYNHIDIPSNLLSGRNVLSESAVVAMVTNTHVKQTHTATSGRSPAYGDELAALENYNHIDIPNTSARGPQFIPDNFTVPSEDSLETQQEQQQRQQSRSPNKGTPRELQPHPSKSLTPAIQAQPSSNMGVTTPRLRDPISNANDTASSVTSRRKSTVVILARDRGKTHVLKGLRFENGLDGVKRDYGVAMECYIKAVELGYMVALYNIGLLYEFGRGVAQDELKATEWYDKFLKYSLEDIEQGDMESQFVLAKMYRNGRGVPKDEAKAMEWYAKAADQGKTGAMFQLKELKKKHPSSA
ncbi:hypothetical protein BGZ96_001925 [Linnemannia gamsii]|uniref:HCP-like protein n=1 Tax=Linnemannia gamsii TaxID=64522 RepID=A0ABQ7JLR6_9FUNG|nr:hypothetical protein BGZ96_001925 [Linnemannia gamsii]